MEGFEHDRRDGEKRNDGYLIILQCTVFSCKNWWHFICKLAELFHKKNKLSKASEPFYYSVKWDVITSAMLHSFPCSSTSSFLSLLLFLNCYHKGAHGRTDHLVTMVTKTECPLRVNTHTDKHLLYLVKIQVPDCITQDVHGEKPACGLFRENIFSTILALGGCLVTHGHLEILVSHSSNCHLRRNGLTTYTWFNLLKQKKRIDNKLWSYLGYWRNKT